MICKKEKHSKYLSSARAIFTFAKPADALPLGRLHPLQGTLFRAHRLQSAVRLLGSVHPASLKPTVTLSSANVRKTMKTHHYPDTGTQNHNRPNP